MFIISNAREAPYLNGIPVYGTSGKCRVDMDDVTFHLCVDQVVIFSNLHLEDPTELLSIGLYIILFGEELK
jgi:hypothetical protein